jgi:uncharacterized protein
LNKERQITFWILFSISCSLSIPIIIWLVRKPVFFLNKIGINEQALTIPYAWVMSLLIATAYIGYTFKAVPFVRQMQKEISGFKLIGIWAALVSGIIEEIFFRKMIMDWSLSMGYGSLVQIILTALSFGIAHGLWILLRREVSIAVPVILSTMVLGGLLGILYIAGGRNLFPCIAAHTIINLVVEPWLILSAVSGKMGH